jgi:hypothetical protein
MRLADATYTCTTGAQIWYRSSVDGLDWTDREPLTQPGNSYPVGVGMTAGRAWAIWPHDFSAKDGRAIERAIR